MNWPTFIDAATKSGRKESNLKNGRRPVRDRWPKIVVTGAVLSAALVAAIARPGFNGFARGVFADPIANPRQQIQPISPGAFASPGKSDTGGRPDTEPWGPFRTTDW
jgi:hypothetical protein